MIFEVNPDRTVPDFDRVGGDAHLRDIAADAVVQLELPLVPRAGDLAVADHAVMEWGAAMGTDIVEGEDAVRVAKEADLGVAEHNATAFADGELFQLERGVEVGHGEKGFNKL